MGRRLGCQVLIGLVLSSAPSGAFAQARAPRPAPESAPATETEAGASSEPVGAEATGTEATTAPEAATETVLHPIRQGLWVQTGFGLLPEDDITLFLRTDVGVPGLIPSLPEVTWQVSTWIGQEEVMGIRAVELFVVPGATRSWVLSRKQGTSSVSVEGGIGLGAIWVKLPDEPFQPGGWESVRAGLVRFAVAARHVFPNGFYLQGQPVGFLIAFRDGADEVTYEAALSGGYQWP